MYKEGFKYHFDQDDNRKINDQNNLYEVQTIEEELLLQRYQPIDIHHVGALKKTATEILQELVSGKVLSNQYSLVRLGKALTKQGFGYTMNRGSKYWRVGPVRHFPDRHEPLFGKNTEKKGEGLDNE